ncbi:hypothetical protein JCM8097_009571 [Rhodosporidiobolus ruineniae]
MPSPALPAMSYAAVVRQPSPWANPAARPPKPSLELPEDVLYDVLEQLPSMLVFEEARNALLACALVSRSWRRLAKRHKDEHLVLHF